MTRELIVNERLYAFIVQHDKKPSAIADKAKIQRDIFSRIIHGKRPIYAEEIIPICKAAGISLEELFIQNSEKDEQ